jgi:hypothetical protein|tara:strand:- start:212 stop:421 length:210 start_codon:yes stop_codon:yes gene_type:complete
MINIKERANNKIYSKIQIQYIELQDLKKELKSGIFRGNITYDEMTGLVSGAQTELEVLNYIYKLIETDD